MSKALVKKIQNTDWYKALLEELKSTIVESSFISKWVVIEGYHKVGSALIKAEDDFKKHGIDSLADRVSLVSQSLGKSRRTIYRAIQFVKKYPDLNKLPEGKDTSWHRICNKYLPEARVDKETCKHKNKIQITIVKCADCNLMIDKQKSQL